MKLNKKKTITKRGRDMTGTGANKKAGWRLRLTRPTYSMQVSEYLHHSSKGLRHALDVASI